MASGEREISAISLENIKVNGQENEEITEQNNGEGDFTNVPLDHLRQEKPKRLVLKDPKDPEFQNKKGKVPRRTIHFSDGILEEYSETEDEDEVDNTPKINPKTLKWLPWFWYYMTVFGSKSLGAADFCGEKIAWFLGITSPKYQYAIDEYNRLKKEEEEEKEREERELEIMQERRLQGNNPDVEAADSVPKVAFSNKAFESHEDSHVMNNNSTTDSKAKSENVQQSKKDKTKKKISNVFKSSQKF